MAINKTNRLAWIVKTIYKAKKITFEDLARKWDEDDTQKTQMMLQSSPKVWAQIEPMIEGLPLVAHNKAFDESCLKAVFRVYQMDDPDYEFHCTCREGYRSC